MSKEYDNNSETDISLDSDIISEPEDVFYTPLNSNSGTRESSVEVHPQAATNFNQQTWDQILNDNLDSQILDDLEKLNDEYFESNGGVQPDSEDDAMENVEDDDHVQNDDENGEQSKDEANNGSVLIRKSGDVDSGRHYKGDNLYFYIKSSGFTPIDFNIAKLKYLVANRMDKALRDSQFPKSKLQTITFSDPINSQSKLRNERPRYLREVQRFASSRNPDNPYQDTSDSELDEIESELELERKYSEYEEKAGRPQLHLLEDGNVCYYCGILIPYKAKDTTSYPTFFKCENCKECEIPTSSVTSEMLAKHESALSELEGSIYLNNNGWISDNSRRPLGNRKAIMTNDDFAKLANETQKLPPDHEQYWERIVEDLMEDPSLWSIEGLSTKRQYAKYWSRGGPLVAGGMSWTNEEGDLFFQALRRFGKHNVWAVQEHIKSRSLAEVVTMIQTMEMELARQKYFGLEVTRLSQVPMAEEIDETMIEEEERCAAILIDQEMKKTWQTYSRTPVETDPAVVNKASLFNLKTLSDLSSRLYIQNEDAGVDRDVTYELYDALKEWLTPIIREVALLHSERKRVNFTLVKDDEFIGKSPITEDDILRVLSARQKSLGVTSFFRRLPDRIGYMLFDDSPSAMKRESFGYSDKSPMWVMDGLGKKYYLNEGVDRAQAEAPDSDQDMSTDDGVSAEEDAECTFEAPLENYGEIPGADTDRLRELRGESWKDYWDTKAREARKRSEESDGTTKQRKRFRATHPLDLRRPMSYEAWKEGVERLGANSYALPIKVEVDAGAFPKQLHKKANVQSMNKTARTHEQQVYLEKGKLSEIETPGIYVERSLARKITKHERHLEEKATTIPLIRPIESYAPGYGILPKNASFMYDPTRPLSTNGYGLGERDRGGLWLMDKSPHELLNSSGYITVSDSEDEEEERMGCVRQMRADEKIEEKYQKKLENERQMRRLRGEKVPDQEKQKGEEELNRYSKNIKRGKKKNPNWGPIPRSKPK